MVTTRKGDGPAKPLMVDYTEMADRLQEMQRGYEDRLARQRASIERLTTLLEERTMDVEDHMRRANDAAITAAQLGTTPRVDLSDDDEDTRLAMVGLMQDMVPRAWLEEYPGAMGVPLGSTPPENVLRSYITWLLQEVDNQKGKQRALVKEQTDLRRRVIPDDWDMYNEDDTHATIMEGYIIHLRQQLATARAETRNVVGIIRAMPVVDTDETPPWEKPGYVPPAPPSIASGVAPSVVERDTPVSVPGRDPDSETIQFDAFRHPVDEDRPGGF
jgi:hypothetical protein